MSRVCLCLLLLFLAPLPVPAQDTDADADLLGTALFAETNFRRLQNGQLPLRPLEALNKAAADHALDMAQNHFLSHTSPTPGRETLSVRLAAVGINLGYRGENLAEGFALEYDEGRPFLPPAITGSGFRYGFDEPDLEWKTAEDAARSLVDQWMASAEHRANLLSPDYRFLGVAGVVVDSPEYLGMPMVKAVQVFSSYPGVPLEKS